MTADHAHHSSINKCISTIKTKRSGIFLCLKLRQHLLRSRLQTSVISSSKEKLRRSCGSLNQSGYGKRLLFSRITNKTERIPFITQPSNACKSICKLFCIIKSCNCKSFCLGNLREISNRFLVSFVSSCKAICNHSFLIIIMIINFILTFEICIRVSN